MTAQRPVVLVVAGPTGVGKTAIAIATCRCLGGEIVSADSRQVYRGMTIGSAAPTADEGRAVRHRLVGFLDVTCDFSVAAYRDAAESELWSIVSGNMAPMVVGGTGLYLSTLVYGWSLTGVAADEAVRARLELRPTPELVAQLRTVDPVTADRLDPADRKRTVRALEVYEVSGQPLSAHHAAAGRRPVPFRYLLFGLDRPREELYQRIDRRVEAMLAAGWLDEVRALLEQGLTGAERAMEGLGYRRLVAVLRGELSLDEATTQIQQDTRRFAKRQLTWFRRMPGLVWLPAEEATPLLIEAWRRAAGED